MNSRVLASCLATSLLAACGSSGEDMVTPPGPVPDDVDDGCPVLFAQSALPEYHVTIAPNEMEALEHEFLDRVAIEATGADTAPYHPIEFRLGVDGEPVPRAMIRLKGQSSWLQAIAFDANPKMQFVIAFNEIDPAGRFMGMRKVELDMPRSDGSYLRQRLALHALRQDGITAQCANNAKLFINDAYYGLYTNVERLDKEFLQRVFPGADDGDLWKGGRTLKTNEETFTWDRLDAFWHSTEDAAALAALADLGPSVREWAAEAVVPHGDGYYIGRANYYLYDHPTRGFLWLPHDLDGAFDYLPAQASPLFPACDGRTPNDRLHFNLVMNDPVWAESYVTALQEARDAYDPADLELRVDQWSAQIAGAVADDPRRPLTTEAHALGVAVLRGYPAQRAATIDAWLTCRSGGGEDADGDTFDSCHDCDDTDGAIHPGATESCNGADDDCDGVVDILADETPCS